LNGRADGGAEMQADWGLEVRGEEPKQEAYGVEAPQVGEV